MKVKWELLTDGTITGGSGGSEGRRMEGGENNQKKNKMLMKMSQ